MGLRLTTKVQVSGWRFLLRRVEHAIVRRDTRMFDDPLQFYSRSVGLGIIIAVLILVGAGLLAYFKPQGKLGGTNLLTDRSTNQLYVILSGQLHPVYNLTSARLALGNPDSPAAVKSSELSKLPLGQTIGIPGAPYATPVSGDSNSTWTLCDTVARPNTASVSVQTSVLAMPLLIDASVDPVDANEAMLATYQGQTWIITAKGRHSIDLNDRALTSAMGIPVTATAVPISEGMFNALPAMGAWELPPIPNAGQPNTLDLPDDLVIGSVFQLRTVNGPRYYVVLPDGIAQVNATTAAALRATQSHGLVEPPAIVPSLAVRIPERVYPSPLPSEPLKIMSRPEEPTLCWMWERGAGDQAPKTTVLSGRHLPIAPASMHTGIKQINGAATVYLDGGKFVQLQSPDPRYGESMYYIDPEGVRYGVPNADAAKALGLGSPKTAPWEVIRLLVDGPVLSKDAALLEHETLPADPNPRKVPAGTPGAPQ
ncbi:ESX-1 secretion system ATPase EccB1 [Mycobacterium kubicae]|uniref:ESX-1 secretion system ATPase EccB1 n=1 Tax=Mycobacterium kubicae TaxID=120959 RepID=A0AAX1JBU5_9MYCO|nr:type VII secretion protein EccB [Mycobacterium kubicae]MCV7094873.1 type VII secretion protein EccB [Mycobacterium kubicae]OBK53899.1 type VII secretion protein EccB [Mycobacterium kubicae]ORV93573.1 type VII secretion protein EccB [Mycobacterium kubicae]QNI14464.1 type VII secretion protein EccB [Mycobacterium kubicae]QPI37987.1 type VII secretion protein EccB [Mycobacterium kubicae]